MDGSSSRCLRPRSGAKKFHQHQKPSVHQQSQIGTVPQLLAGGIAGAFSKTFTAPLARLTILFQLLKIIPGLETHRSSASADVFVHFVVGGLAGITAASATYPLDLVRTRLAAQRRSLCILVKR
ncbi:Solute carrier family 25 member like [Actinidia chinensis var. chinensis]|uniref:Solute carrier family 25 member like n=1 Tax=Actinidia chinensis var. chinensis TaxID=1590841 RepID=A0A2R6RRJ2_ACTCC|nr:Solute carrier family 25 member like [Actinidia chinensis var. chinensis]